MPRYMPHRRNLGPAMPDAIAALIRSFEAARRRRVRPGADNPFEAAMRAVLEGGDGADVVAAIARHGIRLSPLVKRHIFDGFEGVPKGLRLGWAQLPGTQGAAFSLGAFTDRSHFAQFALADGKGRVFVGTDPAMDTHELKARFMFGKEGTLRLPDGPRFGHEQPAGGRGAFVDAVQGGVVGRDDTGRMVWLASWLKAGNRYTLEQVRAVLPDEMRVDLEYRDAIAIAFFAAYMLPQMHGLLIGFGSGNIFRRLNREAPMGAIRRCLRDTVDARAHGMRASGLEDHFADLMHEAKALDSTAGLEAVHGAEPLHLYTSTYSGNYFFTWDSGLQFPAALKSMKIEGNLNRFAAVSAWLERNARLGLTPTEDTVTRAQAAQIDWMLLNDPALIALNRDDPESDRDGAPSGARADGRHAVMGMVDEAARQADRLAERFPGPLAGDGAAPGDSEWLYRQTLSTLLRRLRLPFRFDVEFRSNLAGGQCAIGFTTAGPSMMPSTRYDETTHAWVALDDAERASLSAAYNLRVGLMMAAMAFGANRRIERVSLHIDSIGLEEAVAQQDSAIADLLAQMLRSLERTRSGEVGLGGSKADPKDGDYHGDPTYSRSRPLDDPGEGAGAGEPPAGDERGVGEPSSVAGDAEADLDHADKATVDSRFADLMRDVDFDEMTFDVTRSNIGEPTSAEPGGEDGPSDGYASPVDPSDPLSVLRAGATVRTMVTVTFPRELLARLSATGLDRPADTYRLFGANLAFDADGGLAAVESDFDLRDERFAPDGAQAEPETSERTFTPQAARVLGTGDAMGLSIQRADLLRRGTDEFHRLAEADMPSVVKAQQAMHLIERIGDPELNDLAPRVTSALIDGTDTPDVVSQLGDEIDQARGHSRDQLFSGQVEQSIETMTAVLKRADAMFAHAPGVPRYFNSYAERVVYNRLLATSAERTVLIPDELFYAHMELSDVLAQLKGAKAALPHLNAMVSYAPAYPLSHLKLAVQLAREEDWDSARAACLNALRVALDRDDAAFAYYRFAYAEWMRDQLPIAAAAYIMSEHISPGQIMALGGELRELTARAESQCIAVPDSVPAAQALLAVHDLPVWPHTEVASIMADAARVCVDDGMFVPARTLSVACARMSDDDAEGIDVIQAQFLRSLND